MRIRALFQRYETNLLIAIILLGIIITAVNPSFLTLENFFDLAKSYSFLGIFAIGVLIVLISGGIDISFSAIATVGEYAMTVIMIRHGGNIATCFLISCGIGIALGAINALLIHGFNIPTIIATIATLNIYYGILTVLSGGKWIYNLPSWFQQFAIIRVFTLTSAEGIPYGLSIITVVWVFLIVVAWIILRYTTLGRSLYAMGGSMSAARRAGLNILRLQLFVYGFMGFMSGVAGVVQALLVQTVAPNSIVGKELNVIAAVVLGGASLSGGTGTIFGTILGVTLIAIMGNGLTLMRVSSFWYDVCIGLVILIAVGASAYRRKRMQRRSILTGE
ncbi:MAG: ABC transporter permease [Spirochaetia bacterium]|jgi:simple sugar transport system permease protein